MKQKLIGGLCLCLIAICTSCAVQIKNLKTEQKHIYGNCGMCKETIEKAGNVKGLARVEWNKDSKMAKLDFDSIATNSNEILKRIAKAGYDSDDFLAPNEAYSARPECCHYERNPKANAAPVSEIKSGANSVISHHSIEDSNKVLISTADTSKVKIEVAKPNQLNQVFENYFALKDALVKTDSKSSSLKAKALLDGLNSINMNGLSKNEHVTWMKLQDKIKMDVEAITKIKDIAKQRNAFISLSENMYTLIKTSKQTTPIYYQHCPMANEGKGANWLSKEKVIKNPYYGNQMLNCGSVQETIK